jgi:hypothetical protein
MKSKVLGMVVCLAGLTGCSVHYYVAEPTADVPVTSPPVVVTSPAMDASVSLALILPAETPNPGSSYIWEEPYTLEADLDVAVPGFWRLRERPGYTWVVGYWDQDRYIPGYWKPVKSRGRQYAWVPGHWWGKHWIEGKWRPAKRTGYTWVPGYWTRSGDWQEGYWHPTRAPKPNMVWVPGYWLNDEWQEGFWRPPQREGYVWIDGYYNGLGIWVVSQWQVAPPAHRWSPGYWNPRGVYTPGRLEPVRDNTNYVPGHYDNRNRWKPEQWQPYTPQQTQPVQKPLHQQQQQQQPSQHHNQPEAFIADEGDQEYDQKPHQHDSDQQPGGIVVAPPVWSGHPSDSKSPESDRGYGKDKVREAEKTPNEGLHEGQKRSEEVKQKKGEQKSNTEDLDQQLFEDEEQPAQEASPVPVKKDQGSQKARGKKGQAPGQEKKQNPDQAPGQEKKQNPDQAPGQEKKQNPDQAPGQEKKQNPDQAPGQEKKQNPDQGNAKGRGNQ